ncbi:cellulose biosynthesis cyclic di-GMP-binding regulatory protein BcsB [Chitinasiproducens palmae]|uniref:Cyclic di-GMP-binding protein n=1 Tax=Chitinasiproducens palmae TaxID=1770053 RepID=A0A1H2PMQ8_9BURK|nr:cellulose biosynthesis cyclic di-GMP-binding regulatory protein BcsB [Chitinasiproducens palmae]SDV47841.1 cellulose synthase subunit [Chitinasiproducens palmae]
MPNVVNKAPARGQAHASSNTRARRWRAGLLGGFYACLAAALVGQAQIALAQPAGVTSTTQPVGASGNDIGGGGPAAAGQLATPVPAVGGSRTGIERTPTTADPGTVLSDGQRRYALSFRQLGLLYPPQLRGVQGTVGVPFSVRADEVVTAARLHLVYSYSPALITNLSHLKVTVNGQVAATVPLPKEQAGMLLTRDIPLEPRLITDFNQLGVEFVGHYTMQCEDPMHSSLWANLGTDSSLELTVSSLPVANDLSTLPQPFFDRRDVRRLELPFVFGATPGNATLEAAGIVASYFGRLAGYRGALFPAASNQAPATGNAIVFATNDDRPAGLTLPAIAGPTLAVVPQPNDPRAKLLLVLGRDAAELKTAAKALALGQISLTGTSTVITGLKEVPERKPYDAPNWLPTDRPVRFGEINNEAALNVTGYNPDLIRLNLRVPPDLFSWRSGGVPVTLLYRYTPRPTADKSTLNVSINENFVTSLRIPTYAAGGINLAALTNTLSSDGTALRRVGLELPPYLLGANSQLQFHYYYDYVKNGACRDVLLDNVRGAIDPASTIDLSGLPHYAALPDLAGFSNSGFPFTRLADLSESAVLLPDTPTANDIAMYLALMGRMGESTGYPATNVSVGRAADAKNFADKDLLVLGSPNNQALFQTWANAMPFSANGDSRTFDVSQFAFGLLDWWHGENRNSNLPRNARLSLTGGGGDAVLMGFESPLKSGRSVVAIASSTADTQASMLNALLDADLVKQIQGALAVVRDRNVSSIASGETYYVGSLPIYAHLRWALSAHPTLLAIAALIVALLLAALLYRALRAVAARRLKK